MGTGICRNSCATRAFCDTGSFLPLPCLRWSQARRFHEQLSNLAESDENIMLLTRLNARIQEGIDAEVWAVDRSVWWCFVFVLAEMFFFYVLLLLLLLVDTVL